VARWARQDWACAKRAKIPHLTREPSLHNAGIIPWILQQCREWKKRAIESREPAAFNDDALYRRSTGALPAVDRRLVAEASRPRMATLRRCWRWCRSAAPTPGLPTSMVPPASASDAAQNGPTETVRALVQECGGDASTANTQGDTPVMVARINSHWDTASCLVTELGADVRESGASCLHYAAVARSETEQADEQAIKVAGEMMERGSIELLSQTNFHSGLTPLDCAIYVGKGALARMLAARLGSGDDSAASELLEQARWRVLEASHAPLALFRGLPWAVKLGPDSGMVEFSAFSTLRSTYSCLPGGKGYYQVEILGLDTKPQYGFATAVFERMRGASNHGVGDDEHSCAVDGARQRKWHNGKEPYECTWKEGES
jgi:hypothetical protein